MQTYDIAFGFVESDLDRTHNEYDFDVNLPTKAVREPNNPLSGSEVEVRAWRNFETKGAVHSISIDKDDAPLADVLDSIVSQMQNYTWSNIDNVINIYPTKGRSGRLEKLLNLRIRNFTYKRGGTVHDITLALEALPEIRSFLREDRLNWRTIPMGLDVVVEGQLMRKVDHEINFANVSFRTLLNRITLLKKGGWKVRSSHFFGSADKEYIDIDI